VRNAIDHSCFLGPGDRPFEAVLRRLHCSRGAVLGLRGVFGLNVAIVSCLKWGNRVIYSTYLLHLLFSVCAQCNRPFVFFGSR